jgi:hypothetical protein
MKNIVRFILIEMLIVIGCYITTPTLSYSLPTPGECQDGVLPSGALSRICIPATGWNGDLVVWAHGYPAYNEPVDFQNLMLPDGTYLPDLVQKLGFAFATTSYRTNGLAILQGTDDIRELVSVFPDVAGSAPRHTYMTGASEGGIITTLLVEQSPEMFSGGLACCGPIGDMKKQLNYMGDFRVLFDYFFPGIIPGSPISIPQEVIDDWESVYMPAVMDELADNPEAFLQLIKTSKATLDQNNMDNAIESATGVLWYDVFATNDAAAKLNGNPYGNRLRWYRGSDNDLELNQSVQRFTADPAALTELTKYQTTGTVTIPLVTLHTTGDEIVPFWHEVLYFEKVSTSGSTSVTQLPVKRYGHCNFTTQEVLAAFGLLVLQVTGEELEVSSELNTSTAVQGVK